jgi:geranylgeranyl pyrophosphate synthase
MDISLLMAMAYQKANQDDQQKLKVFWQQPVSENHGLEEVHGIMKKLNIISDVQTLFQQYKQDAYSVLTSIRNPNLKCILHRVIGKIFGDLTKMGCCNDHQK